MKCLRNPKKNFWKNFQKVINTQNIPVTFLSHSMTLFFFLIFNCFLNFVYKIRKMAGLKLNWVMVLSFFNFLLIVGLSFWVSWPGFFLGYDPDPNATPNTIFGSEFIWAWPFIVTVKGSEKNDPDLRKGILGKSLTPFLLYLYQFYFRF